MNTDRFGALTSFDFISGNERFGQKHTLEHRDWEPAGVLFTKTFVSRDEPGTPIHTGPIRVHLCPSAASLLLLISS
jgi:hypothetical protein